MPRYVSWSLAAVSLAVLAFGVGHHRARIDPGPGLLPLSEFSANVGAGDLLQPQTAPSRLAVYLDELTAAGYKKQVRIILPPDWGPFIYAHWFPVIRAKGFKVLAILGQERRDSAADVPAAIAWMEHILPLVRDDLIGVQIVNECAASFTAAEYAAYHQRVAPRLRALAPGVPIVAGDFGSDENTVNCLKFWEETVAAGASDYDVLSVHLTGSRRQGQLTDFARRLRAFRGAGRIWITECDWGHLPFLRGQGLNVEEAFIYCWNDDPDGSLIRRPGGRLVQLPASGSF